MNAINPECVQEKHENCDGNAWDEDAGILVACQCSCHDSSS